ncbi:MAG: hypothetical protein NTV05_17190 [Acidobacteria bacterium]|nr:hypothetical protein [Acidobacteriota bacterium]
MRPVAETANSTGDRRGRNCHPELALARLMVFEETGRSLDNLLATLGFRWCSWPGVGRDFRRDDPDVRRSARRAPSHHQVGFRVRELDPRHGAAVTRYRHLYATLIAGGGEPRQRHRIAVRRQRGPIDRAGGDLPAIGVKDASEFPGAAVRPSDADVADLLFRSIAIRDDDTAARRPQRLVGQ